VAQDGSSDLSDPLETSTIAGEIIYWTKLRVSADFDSSMMNGIVSSNTRIGYATSAIGEFSDSILAARRSTNNKWAQ
jgi:hypothetical protein